MIWDEKDILEIEKRKRLGNVEEWEANWTWQIHAVMSINIFTLVLLLQWDSLLDYSQGLAELFETSDRYILHSGPSFYCQTSSTISAFISFGLFFLISFSRSYPTNPILWSKIHTKGLPPKRNQATSWIIAQVCEALC